ncbi:MAG TPA: hypothetical protein VK166_15575, partial [Chitinophagaceae bacterium]|nr:hypothetical protein [Chitinophagaceae bacterium]
KLVDNKAMAAIGELKNLKRLSLSGANINDSGLAFIRNMQELEFLNLARTGVTTEGLAQLAALKNLKSLYLFETSVDSSKAVALKAKLPGVHVETGRIIVPILEGDTSRLK